MKVKNVKNWEGMTYKDGKPQVVGEYFPSGHGIFIILPCLHPFHDHEGRWVIENADDETKITLTPSIFCSPQVTCWHGYLRNGEFINA